MRVSKKTPAAIKVKWDHFGQRYKFVVETLIQEDFWKALRVIKPDFDGNCRTLMRVEKTKYVQLQPKYVLIFSNPRSASNANEGSTFLVRTPEIDSKSADEGDKQKSAITKTAVTSSQSRKKKSKNICYKESAILPSLTKLRTDRFLG
uniref:Uncharacterized protein n=1 Tax=Ditylenchus dipsaci TaxID=166011 RepID=A0A915DBW0_9BILA